MAEATARAGTAPRLRAASATDRGRVRSGNEDRVHADPALGLFVVADGVGGHAAGEVAATIAVDVITQRLARPAWSAVQAMREAIALANNEIHAQAAAHAEYTGMTCVLTAASIVQDRLIVGHVGDSRLYRLDATSLVKLTHDHSPIGEREDGGELSETEAMRHPRRNEVFRDVGSAFHEPDDPEFIEILETTFDPHQAVLLCSDGLSDMLTGSAIERVVRQHAGDPARVVEALILAANEAGGRDNVSVVYVEGERFAALPAVDQPPAAGRSADADPAHTSYAGRWLVLGLVLGLAAGLGLAWMLALDDPVAFSTPRTVDVSPGAAGGYTTIAEAMTSTRAGDTVRLSPGTYAETVTLADGVHLVARDPGTVTLVAPPDTPAATIVTAAGARGHRISGLRLSSTAEQPAAIALRVAGGEVEIDDLVVDGLFDIGIDAATTGRITIRASRFNDVRGTALRVGSEASPVVVRNVFVQGRERTGRALELGTPAAATVDDNVFIGYGDLLIRGAASGEGLGSRNLVLPAPAAPRRGGR